MDRPPLRIRAGAERDFEPLLRIYNHYVESSHVTFDDRALGPDERRGWFQGFSEKGPHRLLVGECPEGVVGYACSTRFRPKPAYASTVETTVYVGPDHLGRGAGRELYAALLGLLPAEPGLHRAVAGIALPNPASVELHEALGFHPVGVFRQVGFKFGRFWDVAWYERGLDRA